jgi:glycosyltransferase involved in cell wall biosynthesis
VPSRGSPGVWVTVVIPAYNEAQRLPLTLGAWSDFFARQGYRAEVLVVDDGSRDATSDVVQAFARERAQQRAGASAPEIRLLTLGQNQGKGGAVRAGMLAAAGAYVFYVDADLNIAPEHITPALACLSTDYDVVAGQRRLRDYASTERSATRVLAGALVQATRRVVVLPTIRDVEVLFLARRLGARIKELPVEVTFRPGSSYDLRRHLLPFLGDILAIRRHALSGAYS